MRILIMLIFLIGSCAGVETTHRSTLEQGGQNNREAYIDRGREIIVGSWIGHFCGDFHVSWCNNQNAPSTVWITIMQEENTLVASVNTYASGSTRTGIRRLSSWRVPVHVIENQFVIDGRLNQDVKFYRVDTVVRLTQNTMVLKFQLLPEARIGGTQNGWIVLRRDGTFTTTPRI